MTKESKSPHSSDNWCNVKHQPQTANCYRLQSSSIAACADQQADTDPQRHVQNKYYYFMRTSNMTNWRSHVCLLLRGIFIDRVAEFCLLKNQNPRILAFPGIPDPTHSYWATFCISLKITIIIHSYHENFDKGTVPESHVSPRTSISSSLNCQHALASLDAGSHPIPFWRYSVQLHCSQDRQVTSSTSSIIMLASFFTSINSLFFFHLHLLVEPADSTVKRMQNNDGTSILALAGGWKWKLCRCVELCCSLLQENLEHDAYHAWQLTIASSFHYCMKFGHLPSNHYIQIQNRATIQYFFVWYRENGLAKQRHQQHRNGGQAHT